MRALLSAYDKTGMADFARALVDLGFEIVSTGGTQAYLAEQGILARTVSDVTGFPEILDGRVKTLHPAIHAGLLARSDLPDHCASLEEHGIEPIDILAVNLYPFEATVSQPGCSLADALEQIDIGGPAMIRAAAKNYPDVVVITNPGRYEEVLRALIDGEVSDDLRRALAAEAFQHVSTYDALVAEYLRAPSNGFQREITIPGRRALELRYGENPHQAAAAYLRPSTTATHTGVLHAAQLQGKELSYNNILDADAALCAVKGIDQPVCAVVKHTIPCGLAIHDSPAGALAAALASDPISAFGGIVALNREVDRATAEGIARIFLEVILAPSFSQDARDVLTSRRNLRLLQLPADAFTVRQELETRSVSGGFLVQVADAEPDPPDQWSLATATPLPDALRADLVFAWHACRFVKSNAIVLARDRALVGVGPGQPNRLDSVRLAIARAGDRAPGAVLASDAFFPFPDGVEEAIRAGVAAIIQPGGSVRDAEVVSACDRAGVPMMFTGTRHFLH